MSLRCSLTAFRAVLMRLVVMKIERGLSVPVSGVEVEKVAHDDPSRRPWFPCPVDAIYWKSGLYRELF